jgi:FkbM family methyltransferase
MKQVEGIWLLDSEEHLLPHLAESRKVDGRGTYQLHKIEGAIDECPLDRRRHALDIGGHVGLWSRILVKHFRRITAFEPVPAFRECFVRNVQDRSAVKLLPFALGDHEGKVRLRIKGIHTGYTHIDPKGDIEAGMVTLDSLALAWAVDFIKIDVEGQELPVIRGAERTIRENRPVMVIEQKPNHAERYGFREKQAAELLTSWGAKTAWIIGGDHCFTW